MSIRSTLQEYGNQTQKSEQFLAELLLLKLLSHKKTGSVVISTNDDSEQLGKSLAGLLEINFANHYCRSIPHPSHAGKTIGSITSEEVVLHDNSESLPQDYVQHKILLFQRSLGKSQSPVYHPGQTLILLRKQLTNTDEILALVQFLQKQKCTQLTVACQFISRSCFVELEKLVDHVVFLEMIHPHSHT